jgi:hypothetical protein
MELCVRTSAVNLAREGFVEQYPVFSVPAKTTIQQLTKWLSTGPVSSAPEPRNPSVRIPEVVADIANRMERSPHYSTWRLSQETGVSRR